MSAFEQKLQRYLESQARSYLHKVRAGRASEEPPPKVPWANVFRKIWAEEEADSSSLHAAPAAIPLAPPAALRGIEPASFRMVPVKGGRIMFRFAGRSGHIVGAPRDFPLRPPRIRPERDHVDRWWTGAAREGCAHCDGLGLTARGYVCKCALMELERRAARAWRLECELKRFNPRLARLEAERWVACRRLPVYEERVCYRLHLQSAPQWREGLERANRELGRAGVELITKPDWYNYLESARWRVATHLHQEGVYPHSHYPPERRGRPW